MAKIDFHRVNSDSYGNPRYVVHYLEFISDKDRELLDRDGTKYYDYALAKAKFIGGGKFHNRQYGGGIVFQSYNNNKLAEHIKKVKRKTLQQLKDDKKKQKKDTKLFLEKQKKDIDKKEKQNFLSELKDTLTGIGIKF